MKLTRVLAARVHITESSNLEGTILDYLKNEAKLRGVSVLRAIAGFGESGEQSSVFMALSMDLPLIINFYDSSEKVLSALAYLKTVVKANHMICWEVDMIE
jgi:PII-like signaling protein